MPLITLKTNVTLEQPQETCEALSRLTADLLGKPESYVMVLVQDEQHMTFAGTSEAAALIELKSLGLPEDKTGEYSDALCSRVNELTGITASRIYIEFSGPARHMWGWDHRTF